MSIKKETIKKTLQEIYETEKPKVLQSLKQRLRFEDESFYAALEQEIRSKLDEILENAASGEVEQESESVGRIMDCFCQQIADILIITARAKVKNEGISLNEKQLGKHIVRSLHQSHEALEQALHQLRDSQLEERAAPEETGKESPELVELKNAETDDILYFPSEIMGQPSAESVLDQFSHLETRQVPEQFGQYVEDLGGLEWAVRYFKNPEGRIVQILTSPKEKVHVLLIPTYADEDEVYAAPDFLQGLCLAKIAESVDSLFASQSFKVRDLEGNVIEDQRIIRFVAKNLGSVTTPITDIWCTDMRDAIAPEITRLDIDSSLFPLYLRFAFPQLDDIVERETGYAFEPVEMIYLIANIMANVRRYSLSDEPVTIRRVPKNLERELRSIQNPYMLREYLFSSQVQQSMEQVEMTYKEYLKEMEAYIRKHPRYAEEGDMTNPFQFGNIHPLADFYANMPELPQTSYLALDIFDQLVQAMLFGGQFPFKARINRDGDGEAYFEIEWSGWPEGMGE